MTDGPPVTGRSATSGDDADDVDASTESPDAPVVLLTQPRDGLPAIVEDDDALRGAAERLAAGHGPVAVDAERASGYRYGSKAYLVQLRRAGSGTVLIDPIECPDLTVVNRAIDGAEWVLHAASQDLACLVEIGLRPPALFDTELAGRLLGYPRVALGTMVEELLGFRLEKGHSAADWSTRPLPEPWIRYAALDVELLVELRDVLANELVESGKDAWAAEEFEALRVAPAAPPREDPWRRTSGLHQVHRPRQLAAVRELWQRRDRIAERRNIAPGRILPDAAIVEAALAMPTTVEEMAELPGFRGKATRRSVGMWFGGIEAARHLRAGALPPVSRPGVGLPPPRTWAARFPEAAARFQACRAVLADLSSAIAIPVENLLPPEAVRRLAWEPPDPVTPEVVEAALLAGGARHWQAELCGPRLAAAVKDADVTTAASTAAAAAKATITVNAEREPGSEETADDA